MSDQHRESCPTHLDRKGSGNCRSAEKRSRRFGDADIKDRDKDRRLVVCFGSEINDSKLKRERCRRKDDELTDTGKIDLLLAETRVHGYPDTRMSLGIPGLRH
jgi:hypothetical protein